MCLFARIARSGFISEAARAAGISRQQHYEWSRKYPEYRERVEDAKAEYLDILPAECDRRAMAGSDRLLMFWLRMLDPSYRDGYKAARRSAAQPHRRRRTEITRGARAGTQDC